MKQKGIATAVIAVIVVVVIAVVGVGVYLLIGGSEASSIVGTWQGTFEGKAGTIVFKDDGTLTAVNGGAHSGSWSMSGDVLNMNLEGQSVEIRVTFVGSNTMELCPKDPSTGEWLTSESMILTRVT
jgi:hypothetical protein